MVSPALRRSHMLRAPATIHHGEVVRFVLAMVVLVGGGALLALVWFAPTGRDPAGLVTAIVAIISGVLGHYFGSRGVERAQQVAEVESDLEQEATAKLSDLRRLFHEYERVVEAVRHEPAIKQRLEEVVQGLEEKRE